MSCFQSEKGGGVSCCFHLVVYDLIQPVSELESQQEETSIVKYTLLQLKFDIIPFTP